jgi:hypothetical protein
VKSSYRIGVALALGIVIILGALYVEGNTPVTASTGTLIASAPERSYIESRDSDGDGVKDWEEGLGGDMFKTIQTPSSTYSGDVASAEYVPPTTFTGKFSEAFFKDYLQGKMNGQDFTDPSALVGNAVQAIDTNTESKRHTRLELTIIPTTGEALREYGNTIPEIIAEHSIETENAAKILAEALASNDTSVLKKIDPIVVMYQNTLKDILAMPVPDTIVEQHVALLNAYEASITNLSSMQNAFNDPLYALARMKGYEDDGKVFAGAFKAISEVLASNGITYSNDESGAFFYLFDI